MNSYVRPHGRRLRRRACRLGCSDLGVRTRARHPALGRRRDDAARGGAQPGLRRALRADAAAWPARCTSPRARAIPNILTFDMGGTSTDVSLCQGGEPTIGRETTIGQFRIKVPSRRRAHRRRGRRLDRPRARAHARAARRPRVGGRRARPGGLRRGRRGADGDRRQRRRRPPAAAPDRRRDGARRRGRRAPPSQTIADAIGLSLDAAAEGILAIVNENMAGALRVDLRPARPRPARVRARRLRRRRARCTPTRSPS